MELKKYKIGDLVQVTRGASLGGEFYATQGNYVRLTCGNFDYRNNCFKENQSKDNIYYTGGFKEEFLLEKGDIITPLTEQAIGLLGSTARIPESGKYIQSQDIAKIDCNESLLDKDFAFYLISSACVKQQLSAAAQQTKIRHTSPDKIKECTVWIPSLDIQKRIGRILTDIDNKIAINRQINDNLEAMAKQLYDYWFVQFDFPNEEGKPYKSSGGAMVYNERLKREIPVGWQVENLVDFAEIKNGATPSTSDDTNYGGDIVWITPKDLSDQQSKFVYQGERNITKQGLDSCSTSMLPINSVLMSSRAPIGLISIAKHEVCTNQGFKSFIPKNMEDSIYLYYYIKHHIKQIEQLGTGTTFKEVSRDDLCKFPILVVGANDTYKQWVELQDEIANKQFVLTKEIAELTKQRDELLPLLMNGQATVNYHLSDD
ncbi:restriction endonuclease subunit S [Bacteroides xylanisolvens]|uniref:restriction endonuclease subunit S n=1 Tax=Bacteroides xylanisolvens TaxID=371601 RepID=UPI0039B592E0